MKSISYANAANGREYRMEIGRDLLGDWTIAMFYGAQRKVRVFASRRSATRQLRKEHRRRLDHGYRVVKSPRQRSAGSGRLLEQADKGGNQAKGYLYPDLFAVDNNNDCHVVTPIG